MRFLQALVFDARLLEAKSIYMGIGMSWGCTSQAFTTFLRLETAMGDEAASRCALVPGVSSWGFWDQRCFILSLA